MGRLIAGRYEVLAEIGRGGMGLVAQAFDHRLETEVAVKVLRPGLTKDSGDKDSLIKEARVLARLTHPSIVRLFDLAETEVGLMLVLEYVRGPNLAEVLKARWRLTETELLFIMRQICAGLDAAHAEGIVHRDLKPPNLLVSAAPADWENFQQGVCGAAFLLNAQIKITDFGISKLLSSRVEYSPGGASGEATWSPAGTPLYMAPEQFRGEICTPATDVYALGVVAYQALSGTPPFQDHDMAALARRHLSELPAAIGGCSPRVNQAIQRALAKSPHDRFPSAGAFMEALEGGVPATLDPPRLESDALDRAAEWISGHKLILTLAGLALIAVPVAALWRTKPPTPTPDIRSHQILDAGGHARPALGKIFELPLDLDPVPKATGLPPPGPAPSLRAGAGPRHPRVAWTGIIETEYEQIPWVDGVGPDGTVYVREEKRNSLWAVRDGGFRWGYRDLNEFGLRDLVSSLASHVDFRDPGRVWLAWCPDRARDGCRGVVLNGSGQGGRSERVPEGMGLPVNVTDISSSFIEDDAQSSHWPETGARYRSTSRLGVVTLTDREKGWSIPLDGSPNLGVIPRAGGLIVSTNHGAIYALDLDGKVLWTYKSATPPEALQVLACGDLAVLAESRQKLSSIRAGTLRWRFDVPGNIALWKDRPAGLYRFAVADTESSLYFVAEGGASATFAVDRDGKLLWTLPWGDWLSPSGGLSLDLRGRLYVAFDRYQVRGKSRAGVICVNEQ